jgi:hypothetical protein
LSAPAFPALAPGFDPQDLPDTAPPVPDGRSRRWLTDRAADPAEREAGRQPSGGPAGAGHQGAPTELVRYLERFVAGCGATDPTDRQLGLRPLPRAQVVASHLEQDVVFDLPGSPGARLRLSGTGADQGPAAFPFTGPVAVVGTVPPAARAAQGLGRELRQELQVRLDQAGVGWHEAVAVDQGRRWVEPVLLVDCTDAAPVRWAARLSRQPFLTVWRVRDGRPVLEVVDLPDRSEPRPVASGPAALGRVVHRPCPLLPAAGRADLCRMHGGPWISRSITAAARWEGKRSQLLAALGCDTCGDGAITVLGRRVLDGARQTRDVRLDGGTQSRHDELVGLPDLA